MKAKLKKKTFLILIIVVAIIMLCVVIAFVFCNKNSKYFKSNIVNDNISFEEGLQSFDLKTDSLQENGLDKIEEAIKKQATLPEKSTIAYLEADISTTGKIGNFKLTVYGFNDEENYEGTYFFEYNSKNHEMKYLPPKDNNIPTIPILYDENYSISYLSQQIKRLPLEEQIKRLDFSRYVLKFQSNTQLTKDIPIIDGSENKNLQVLSFEEYNNFMGGKSDGKTAIIFTLYDGTSAISKNLINYKLDALNKGKLATQKNNIMKCDYIVANNQMKITRDYGETWIDVGISENDMKETLKFYNSSHTILEDSNYISENAGGIIAVIYGKAPKLSISYDDGNSWESKSINFSHNIYILEQLPLIKRVVGFTDDKNGYLAFGSEHTMGSGECKFSFYTNDGGNTWHEKSLPLNGTSSVLTGMSFSDSKNGILSLKSGENSSMPNLFYTTNSGDTWNGLKLPDNSISSEVGTISKVDSFSFKNNKYTLVLGNGASSNKKVSYISNLFSNIFEFEKFYTEIIHTVG